MKSETSSAISVTDARDFLRWYILYLAEEKFAPFLYLDCEVRLWKAAHEPGIPLDPLTEEALTAAEAAMLRFLAHRAGGWYIGTGGVCGQPRFVTVSEWRSYVSATEQLGRVAEETRASS